MEGIAELLAARVQLVTLASTGRDLVYAIGRTSPDLVITDFNMPHGSGVDAMKSVRAAGTKLPFLLLSMHAEGPLVASILRAGARGYVLKSAAGDELLRAVDVVLAGAPMSPRPWAPNSRPAFCRTLPASLQSKKKSCACLAVDCGPGRLRQGFRCRPERSRPTVTHSCRFSKCTPSWNSFAGQGTWDAWLDVRRMSWKRPDGFRPSRHRRAGRLVCMPHPPVTR